MKISDNFATKIMPLDRHENTLSSAIDKLVYELGFSSANQLWDEAGETNNRAAWYRRIAPDSNVRTTEKQLTKLINGLERNGHKLSQEQKVMLYSAVGIKVIKQEELERTQKLEELRDPDRQHLLETRLARFVPGTRHDEIADILKLIEHLKSSGGYLLITGSAGEGKTTLIAQLIVSRFGREQLAYHFIPFKPGRDHQVTLLRSLMASLVLKYPHFLSDFWTQIFHRDTLTGIFEQMLRKISGNGKQEVLFIDGLDQIRPEADKGERDLDFLPLEVPKGIVIVLSTRPNDVLKPLALRSPVCEYQLPKLRRTDVDRILTHYAIHLRKGLVDQLYQVTQQSALYIDLVAKELIQTGTGTVNPEKLLRRISHNPENIFSLSIDRLTFIEDEWKTVLKPILGLLLAAQEPLSTSAISQILLLDEEELRKGLRKLGGLVEEDGREKHYLYHLKLQEFLQEDKSNPAREHIISQREEQLRHRQLADWCAGNDPMGGKTIWQEAKDVNEQERRTYASHYYVTHLYKAHEWHQLFQVLDGTSYGLAKIERDPSTRSYAKDLDLGRRAASWEGWSLEEGITYLPYLWRYSLLRCSLTSRADTYTSDMVEVLLVLGREVEALGLAELLTDPSYKVEILLRIGQRLRMQQECLQVLLQAAEAAMAIDTSNDRDKALAAVAEGFIHIQEWEQVETIISQIQERFVKDEALIALGLSLAQAQVWKRAQVVIRTIKHSGTRAVVLVHLVALLGQAQEWEQAQELIKAIERHDAKVGALAMLGVSLAQAQQQQKALDVWDQAKQIALSIDQPENRDKTLFALGILLTQAQAWERAQQVFLSIEEISRRTEALEMLRTASTEVQKRTQVRKVVSLSEKDSTKALRMLGEALVEAQEWERVEAVIHTIEDGDERIKLLRMLGEALIEAQDWERAEAVIHGIEWPYSKVEMLLNLGKRLILAHHLDRIEAICDKAEASVLSIKESEGRADLLIVLGALLAQMQKWERAKRVWLQAEALIHNIENSTGIKAEMLLKLGTTLEHSHQHEWAQRVLTEAETALLSPIEGNYFRVEMLLKLGATLEHSHQHEWAQRVWTEVESIIPTFEESRVRSETSKLLGLTLARISGWEEAEAILSSIEEETFRTEVLRDLGEELSQSQVWEQADKVIHSIEENDIRAKALQDFGMALAKAQQWEWAQKAWIEAGGLNRIIEERDVRARAITTLGDVLIQQQQWEQAESVISSIEDGYIRTKSLGALAVMLTIALQWEKAERIWSKAEATIHTIKDTSAKARAMIVLGAAYSEIQQDERSEILWLEVEKIAETIKSISVKDEVLQNLVRTLIRSHQWEQAERLVDLISIASTKAEMLWELSEVFVNSHQWKKAEKIWVKLANLAPRNEARKEQDGIYARIEILRNLGSALIQAHQWEQVEVVVNAIEKSEVSVELLEVLCVALIQAQEWERANILIDTIKNDDFKKRMLIALGTALALAQEQEQVETLLNSTWDVETKVRVLAVLGVVFSQTEDWERTEKVWTEIEALVNSIKGGGITVRMLSVLGKALIQAKDWQRASKVWTEVEATPHAIEEKTIVLKEMIDELKVSGKPEQLLLFVQSAWRRADTRAYAIRLLPLAACLISLEPAISTAFCEGFTWVDTFLKS